MPMCIRDSSPCSWTLTAFAEILYLVHCYKQSMALFKEPQAA